MAARTPSSYSSDPRLNAPVRRHLRALGLESAEAYLAWCRQHGFSPRLNKTLPQRQQELHAAKKLAAERAARTALQEHLDALGLKTGEDYQVWCRQHGFGEGLHKSRAQRHQEVRCVERLKQEAGLLAARHPKRQRRETVEQIARGEIPEQELTSPAFHAVHRLFQEIGDRKPVRDAFLALLLQTEKHADFFHVKPVVPRFGPQSGNTFLDALCVLAHWHARWMRPLETWKPARYNARRQFGSLLRHLLAAYDVPACMDTAWFRGHGPEARQQQGWFLHVGIGQNIRKADIPLPYTKRMAHAFLNAPPHLTVEMALRWAQVVGLGGDAHLAEAVVATRLGEQFEHEPFWVSVLHFFLNNPLLDTAYAGPIVDYVHHRRYTPQERVGPDGGVVYLDPPEPDFTMKGRTVASLLRRVEAWHRELARETRSLPGCWPASGIGGYTTVDEDAEAGALRCWTIEEILSSHDLQEEGKAMNHCVATYRHSCAHGQKSIWSMKVEYPASGVKRRVLTIEVINRTKYIRQVRGRGNSLPTRSISGRSQDGWAILQQWARQEGLAMPKEESRAMRRL
jgi:hypothetical protein